MMDRALGAIATGTVAATSDAEAVKRFGMMYQWGRKDPFTPTNINAWTEVQIYNADGIAITKGTNGIAALDKQSEFKFNNTTITTINHLIQNPSTHYDKGDGTNWVPIASTTDLTKDWWNPTIKTIYDPCPNGYIIPENGTYGTGGSVTTHPDWSEWLGSGLTAGRTWTSASSFFPASGQRYAPTGQFINVGPFGFSWMSTSNNMTHGYRFYFYTDFVYPNHGNHRSNGYPVRCIKE